MSWRKHFTPVDNGGMPLNVQGNNTSAAAASSRFESWLPEVYAGSANRLTRYAQYDNMDTDTEINTALDTIAEFGTQEDEYSGLPFCVQYMDDPSDTESKIITKTLQRWCNLNQMHKRVFRIFRNTIKYGDQIFIRDPETYELMWVDPANVEKVIVNESEGKKIETYFIKNLSPITAEQCATDVSPMHTRPYGSGQGITGMMSSVNVSPVGYQSGAIQGHDQGIPVDAKHVVHISLTEGMDGAWPFGVSILEPVFKTFKQKELLEDSILIYRVHRAPERRVFFIDVGNMPPHKAKQYLEQVKYEVQQKRIPSKNSKGQSVADSSYNPMSVLEDYFFAQTCLSLNTKLPLLDGRTLSLQQIIDEYKQGKTNWVYSQNTKTHELEPGKIVWADVTRRNAQTIRVYLDNGEYVDATPDHRFIMRDGTEVEAQHLKPEDSLMPLYLIDSKTGSYNHRVMKIEWLDEREDTGDITIETESGSHIFATSAGVFVHNSEGRGSKVDTLPGGENLGQIDDLKYFSNKLMRGLRVPSSYLPTGPEDGSAVLNDGKVGIAYIQEFRFAKYVERLQRQIQEELDHEFKMFLKYRGIELDSSNFYIEFNKPMNFSSYREIQLESERAQLYSTVSAVPHLSNQFKLKKYLGLTDDEMKENERLWRQENGTDNTPPAGDQSGFTPNLGNMGIRPDMDTDLDLGSDIDISDLDDVNMDTGMNTDVDAPDQGGIAP